MRSSSSYRPGAINLDNWAHVGGFFAGVVLTWFMGPLYELHPEPETEAKIRVVDGNDLPQKTWRTAALFSVGLVAAIVYAVMNWRYS